MPVSKKNKAIYNAIFDGSENFVANTIQKIQSIRELNKFMPAEKIPEDYARRWNEYWSQFGKHYSPKWGWFYAARNDIDDVRYIPSTLYYTTIDQHFNSKKLGWGFNDKNYYSIIFKDIKQPETLVRNIGGLLFDADYKQISAEDAIKIIHKVSEIIYKPALESGSGRGIQFVKTDNMDAIKGILKGSDKDYAVQKVIEQHPSLTSIHPGSVNSIRVASLLMDDGVHILSSCLRMGAGDSRVDNHHAGGMSSGINADGTLQKYAYYLDGKKTENHPSGFVFEGFKVPAFDKVIELVFKAHPRIGHFRLVGWDIAVDKDCDPVLIECNMRKNGIELHEFSNGPYFGDLTDRVLKEVFSGKA